MRYDKYPDLKARWKERWALHRELWELERLRFRAAGVGNGALDEADFDHREAKERLAAAEQWREKCNFLVRPLAEYVRRYRAAAVEVARLRFDRETARWAE